MTFQHARLTPAQSAAAKAGASFVDVMPPVKVPESKPRKKRCKTERIFNPYEFDIQRRLVGELRDMLPPDYIVQANVQERAGFISGGKARDMGQEPGWPDLGVHGDGRTWLIEMKDAEGVLTASQKLMHPRIIAAGIPLLPICRDLHTAVAFLRANGARFRRTLP